MLHQQEFGTRHRDRHIPPTMLSTDENERQFDESLRIMFNDNINRSKSSYSFTGAWLMGRLNYSDKLAVEIIPGAFLGTLVMKAEEKVIHGTIQALK